MEFSSIIYEKKNGVATITKNNPDLLYGMSRGVLAEMTKALEDAGGDPDTRVVVVTAAGEGFHHGGMVNSEIFPDGRIDPIIDYEQVLVAGHRMCQITEALDKPVIGVAKGGALGGGFESLHCCDFIIAAETARFSQPEVLFGMMCGWGGSQRVVRHVPWLKAKEILLTGEEIDGKQAEAIGLINKAVPLDKVDEEVEKLIEKLKRCSPTALAFTKRVMNKTWEMTGGGAGLAYEIEACAVVGTVGDYREALQAYNEQRKPVFKPLFKPFKGD